MRGMNRNVISMFLGGVQLVSYVCTYGVTPVLNEEVR
jgi:hypothetical protein